MTQIQKKYLVQNVRRFNASDIYDIPPQIWKYIGLNGRNEEKINFIIHLIHRQYE